MSNENNQSSIHEDVKEAIDHDPTAWGIALLALEASLSAARKVNEQLKDDPTNREVDPIYGAHVSEVMGALASMVEDAGPSTATKATVIMSNLIASWIVMHPHSKATNYFRSTLSVAMKNLNMHPENN